MIRKLATTLALVLGLGVAATTIGAVDAAPASAAACLRTATVAGRNAYGYGRFSSLSEFSKYVRTAPTATLCIRYAAAYGGYYIDYVSCGRDTARLSTNSLSVTSGAPTLISAFRTSVACGASASWKWDRTWPTANQCASVYANARWDINQATGAVSYATGYQQDDYFVPKSGC